MGTGTSGSLLTGLCMLSIGGIGVLAPDTSGWDSMFSSAIWPDASRVALGIC